MMTCGSFMKWDMWKCLVVRNSSRKNVFSFETQGKTNAGFKRITAGEAGGKDERRVLSPVLD